MNPLHRLPGHALLRAATFAGSIAVGLSCLGCAATARALVPATGVLVPATVDAGLETFEDPATQARATRLLDGTLEGLGEAERAEKLHLVAKRLGAWMTRGFKAETLPGISAAARQATSSLA